MQQVATATGVSKALIWKIETDVSCNPQLNILKELAGYFHVKVSELIGENPIILNEREQLFIKEWYEDYERKRTNQ